jgi:hypothetical protein
VVEATTVVAGIIGLIAGAAVAHRGLHLNPGALPDSAVYLFATKENPFPVTALNVKATGSMAYMAGSFIGDLVKAVKG